ncbi:hypothetical protein [Chitinophaga niabensis]|uniref:Uncharacterized protein n=1 Tax=Chitinophaga niabensis TaxID=536979 RepID=A0A1N6E3Q2_9BACT|nr:hypothetical protein [Chitinophaga niabensis]SIN77634.1 hypothetical protein SAMN04488055_1279 [Chitinophaga niabensis]
MEENVGGGIVIYDIKDILMKKIFLAGAIIGLLLVLLSLLAKVNHWDGASTMLNFGIGGFVLLVVCGGILIMQSSRGVKR